MKFFIVIVLFALIAVVLSAPFPGGAGSAVAGAAAGAFAGLGGAILGN